MKDTGSVPARVITTPSSDLAQAAHERTDSSARKLSRQKGNRRFTCTGTSGALRRFHHETNPTDFDGVRPSYGLRGARCDRADRGHRVWLWGDRWRQCRHGVRRRRGERWIVERGIGWYRIGFDIWDKHHWSQWGRRLVGRGSWFDGLVGRGDRAGGIHRIVQWIDARRRRGDRRDRSELRGSGRCVLSGRRARWAGHHGRGSILHRLAPVCMGSMTCAVSCSTPDASMDSSTSVPGACGAKDDAGVAHSGFCPAGQSAATRATPASRHRTIAERRTRPAFKCRRGAGAGGPSVEPERVASVSLRDPPCRAPTRTFILRLGPPAPNTFCSSRQCRCSTEP
jgi:hypothetical protein